MSKQIIKLNKINDKLVSEVLDLSNTEKEKLSAYIRIRNAYFKVYWLEEQGLDCSHDRSVLNDEYNNFVQLYGPLNSTRRGNRKLILLDPYGFLILSSVEVRKDQEFAGADVLIKSPKGEIEIFRTSDCVEALSYSLGIWGKVDLQKISEITDKEQDEILRELDQLIYYDPIEEIWTTADKWLSGNVYIKMIKTQEILQQLQQQFTEEEEESTIPMGKYTQPRPWGRKWK